MKPPILKELESEGYVRDDDCSQTVRVPHRVFSVDFEIEENRAVTASEAAVLACVQSGIGQPLEIALRLGLGDGRLVDRVTLSLLKRNAVATSPAGLVLTEAGVLLSKSRRVRYTAHKQRDVRYLPSTARFEWFVSDELPSRGQPEMSLDIPADCDVNADDLHGHRHALHELIEARWQAEEGENPEVAARDLVSIRVNDARVSSTAAKVEVWRHESGKSRLRMVREGIEDADVSKLYGHYCFDKKSGRFLAPDRS